MPDVIAMINLSRPFPFGLDRKTWPFFAGGLVVLLAVLLPFDHALSVYATGQSRAVVDFFAEVTRWGESGWLLYPTAALFVVTAVVARLVPQRLTKLALIETLQIYGLIFVGVGLPGLFSNVVKRLIGRARPEMFDSLGLLNFHPVLNSWQFQSFPSGHTTVAFAAGMVLTFLAPRWIGLGLLYAIAVGVSRLVVGAHYPTDVLTGAVVGTLGAFAVRNFFASRGWGFRRLPDGRIVARPTVAIARVVRQFQRKRAR